MSFFNFYNNNIVVLCARIFYLSKLSVQQVTSVNYSMLKCIIIIIT